MADGVTTPIAASTGVATEDFSGATRLAGSHRQEVISPPIAGAAAAPTTYNATTSSTTAVAANSVRTGLFLDNKSDTDIWLGFGQAAVVSSGIRLPANGGRFCCGPEWQGTITVIHGGSGNKAVAVQEFSA